MHRSCRGDECGCARLDKPAVIGERAAYRRDDNAKDARDDFHAIKIVSFSLKHGLAFFEEGCDAFVFVFAGEAEGKEVHFAA